jgi:DNA-directed RNA polymerase specialized sigma subunit
VLSLRFVDELTQVDIAMRVGVSQRRVSVLLNGALICLRAACGDVRYNSQPLHL